MSSMWENTSDALRRRPLLLGSSTTSDTRSAVSAGGARGCAMQCDAAATPIMISFTNGQK